MAMSSCSTSISFQPSTQRRATPPRAGKWVPEALCAADHAGDLGRKMPERLMAVSACMQASSKVPVSVRATTCGLCLEMISESLTIFSIVRVWQLTVSVLMNGTGGGRVRGCQADEYAGMRGGRSPAAILLRRSVAATRTATIASAIVEQREIAASMYTHDQSDQAPSPPA